MADSKEKLFSDFPGVSTEAWMEKITQQINQIYVWLLFGQCSCAEK